MLALTQRLAGDTAGAKVTAEQARKILEQLYRDKPDDRLLYAQWLCLRLTLHGGEGLALKVAERAVMLLPRAKDAVAGPTYEENLAIIQTIVGENSRCDLNSHPAVTNAISKLALQPSTHYAGPS